DQGEPVAGEFAAPGGEFDALAAEPPGEERPQVGREQPADDRGEGVQPDRGRRPERLVNGADLAVHEVVVEETGINHKGTKNTKGRTERKIGPISSRFSVFGSTFVSFVPLWLILLTSTTCRG